MAMALTRWQVIVKEHRRAICIQYRQSASAVVLYLAAAAAAGCSLVRTLSTDLAGILYKVIILHTRSSNKQLYWRPMILHVHYMPYMQDER